MGELHDHVRVIMRGDAAVRQTSYRGFSHAPPLRIGLKAIWLVDRAEIGFEFAHLIEARRLAGVRADAFDRGGGDFRSDVVDDKPLDAAFERSRRGADCGCAAHRRADPIDLVEADSVEQSLGKCRIKFIAVLFIRLGTPLAEAAADHVGHDDMIFVAEHLRDVVEIAAGARKAVPHDQRFGAALTPFHVMDFAVEHCDIVRTRSIHDFAAPWRSRPTMPVGKKRTLRMKRMPSHRSQRSGWKRPGTSGTPALAAAFETL